MGRLKKTLLTTLVVVLVIAAASAGFLLWHASRATLATYSNTTYGVSFQYPKHDKVLVSKETGNVDSINVSPTVSTSNTQSLHGASLSFYVMKEAAFGANATASFKDLKTSCKAGAADNKSSGQEVTKVLTANYNQQTSHSYPLAICSQTTNSTDNLSGQSAAYGNYTVQARMFVSPVVMYGLNLTAPLTGLTTQDKALAQTIVHSLQPMSKNKSLVCRITHHC